MRPKTLNQYLSLLATGNSICKDAKGGDENYICPSLYWLRTQFPDKKDSILTLMNRFDNMDRITDVDVQSTLQGELTSFV